MRKRNATGLQSPAPGKYQKVFAAAPAGGWATLQAHIEFIVAIHEGFQVYLGRNAKIKEDTGQFRIGL